MDRTEHQRANYSAIFPISTQVVSLTIETGQQKDREKPIVVGIDSKTFGFDNIFRITELQGQTDRIDH